MMPCILWLTVHDCIRVRMRQRARQLLWCHAWLMRAVANPSYTVTSGTDSDAGSEAGAMIRQGSKLSYGSNDSGGSGSSAGAPKVGNPVAWDLSASIPHGCWQGPVPEFTLLWCRVQHITPSLFSEGNLYGNVTVCLVQLTHLCSCFQSTTYKLSVLPLAESTTVWKHITVCRLQHIY